MALNAKYKRIMLADISGSPNTFGVYVDEYERVAVIKHSKDWDGNLNDPTIEITEASSEDEAQSMAIEGAMKDSGYNIETLH